jgi:hypothetical protein
MALVVGRSEARSAVVDWFQPSQLEIVSNIYPTLPVFVDESDMWSAQIPGAFDGAIIFVGLEAQHSHRIELVGNLTGGKMRTYQINLLCYLRDTSGKSQNAELANDRMIDSIQTRLESDRTMGGRFFEAGEGDSPGGDDIVIASTLPRVTKNGGQNVVSIGSTFRFVAQEITYTPTFS